LLRLPRLTKVAGFDEPAPPSVLHGPRRRIPLTEQLRRSKDAIGEKQKEFVAFVRANPGLRIEEINKQLGTRTRDLRLPIRKAIASGTIVVKGAKRSARYFPGKRK